MWVRSQDKLKLVNCDAFKITFSRHEQTDKTFTKVFSSTLEIDTWKDNNLDIQIDKIKEGVKSVLIDPYEPTSLYVAEGHYLTLYYNISSEGKWLGEYTTKERALKVLDQIQVCINSGISDYVFQMPQDGDGDED